MEVQVVRERTEESSETRDRDYLHSSNQECEMGCYGSGSFSREGKDTYVAFPSAPLIPAMSGGRPMLKSSTQFGF